MNEKHNTIDGKPCDIPLMGDPADFTSLSSYSREAPHVELEQETKRFEDANALRTERIENALLAIGLLVFAAMGTAAIARFVL